MAMTEASSSRPNHSNPHNHHLADIEPRPAIFRSWEKTRHRRVHWLVECIAEMSGVFFYCYAGLGATAAYTVGNILRLNGIGCTGRSINLKFIPCLPKWVCNSILTNSPLYDWRCLWHGDRRCARRMHGDVWWSLQPSGDCGPYSLQSSSSGQGNQVSDSPLETGSAKLIRPREDTSSPRFLVALLLACLCTGNGTHLSRSVGMPP